MRPNARIARAQLSRGLHRSVLACSTCRPTHCWNTWRLMSSVGSDGFYAEGRPRTRVGCFDPPPQTVICRGCPLMRGGLRPWWHRACAGLHRWLGLCARHPADSLAARTQGWRDERWWRTVQRLAADDPGALGWPLHLKAWQRAPEASFSASFGIEWDERACDRKLPLALCTLVQRKAWGRAAQRGCRSCSQAAGVVTVLEFGVTLAGTPPALGNTCRCRLGWGTPGQPSDLPRAAENKHVTK